MPAGADEQKVMTAGSFITLWYKLSTSPHYVSYLSLRFGVMFLLESMVIPVLLNEQKRYMLLKCSNGLNPRNCAHTEG